MKYSIGGADKETGENIEITIEAANESAAMAVASRKGIMVSSIVPSLLQPMPPVTQRTLAPPAVTPSHLVQPLEQGYYRGAPVINIAPPRRGNSLGVASLILGILAFLICWIPLVNLLGVPLAALGLLLGIIGLLVAFSRKGASIGYPIAGSAVCALSLFIAISVTGALVGGLKKASDELIKENERRNATNQQTATPARDSGSPANPNKPNVEWASAETPVQQGDVQVRVKSVKIGQVPLKESFSDSTTKSKDSLLMIELEIKNLSDTKKLNYRTWGGSASSFGVRVALKDNFDNQYKLINFGFSAEVVGAVKSESVYPRKSINDVIVFEEPIAKTEYLNLTLPAEQFGGEGMLRMRIPASMLYR